MNQENVNNYSIDNDLENQFKSFKEEKVILFDKIKNLEEKIKEQSKEINELKKMGKKYNIELPIFMENKNDNIIYVKNINTKILKNKEEVEFLETRLKNNNKNLMKRNIIFKLLYRATEDGNTAQAFHQKCDNISGTLTIVKTTKGLRFGGYTEQIWNHNGGVRTDYKGI